MKVLRSSLASFKNARGSMSTPHRPKGQETNILPNSRILWSFIRSAATRHTPTKIPNSSRNPLSPLGNILASNTFGSEAGFKITSDQKHFHFHHLCNTETKASIFSSFTVFQDYISEDEEATLMKEVEPHLKRLKYEFSHWDDAIHGYRETECSRWSKTSSNILARVRQLAFPGPEEQQLPQTHVLDLAPSGVIKPHVDSIKFCGNIICGLCLLSDAVMRLVHVEHKDQIIDILLQQRSLYIMKNESRFNYTHEILGENVSYFGSEAVARRRRVSVICRNHPNLGSE